ncbi:putative secreted RxLR effector protein [Phytophthora cinnamomi]|uniref:putative secreted RxLR effector protein n=1 Tax=Phytophthora cinnamomi TaxID=4785 RepID=UPI002A33B622|nr:putative secreted RxLR effector protein [Phytophthora cinnamomi]KAJ8569535.1 hypothetical protein ON010_g5727 [Phytophthora cinnamomi]
MRFAYIVLVSAVALLTGSNGLTATEINSNEIYQLTSSNAARAVTAEENGKRYLRSDKINEKNENTNNDDEEEKGLFDLIRAFNRNSVARRMYRRWYRAGMNPTDVDSMMKRREAAGEYVDWTVVN